MLSLLERIRAETRPWHQALERRSPLLREGVTAEDYRWYLAKLLGFHAPVESALDTLIEAHGLGPAFDGRRKTALLAGDLEALGPPGAAAVPWSPWVPHLTGLGGLFGCAYVLEGETLGGQVLLRRLSGALPELARASRYLDCYGEQTGERWWELTALLEERVTGASERDAAVAAACQTFWTLGRWLADGSTGGGVQA